MEISVHEVWRQIDEGMGLRSLKPKEKPSQDKDKVKDPFPANALTDKAQAPIIPW